MHDSNVLNERQAATVLGCSVALMRKWRLFGEGPSYCKIGRLVRYRQADIDSFLEAHRVETAGGR
jgi:predicted DNA-binding transcriptional regulator AlpA